MGAKGSKPSHKPPVPRVSSSSNRRTRKNSNKSASANTNTTTNYNAIYFDKTLSVWTTHMQPELTKKKRAIFFFTESEWTPHASRAILSRKVLRWFDIHWYSLLEFCAGQVDDDRARLRFRGVPYEALQQNYTSDNMPRTESERFSEYVEYDRSVALCVRADGLVEGFALFEHEASGDIVVDVICTGTKGRGVGRTLMLALKDHATASGGTAIRLTAVPSAVGFYLRLGFRPEEEREYRDRDDVDMVWRLR